jgi:hypothetical protein
MGFWGTYFQSNPTDIAVHAARPSGLYLASFRDKSCHPSVLEPLNVRGFSKKKKKYYRMVDLRFPQSHGRRNIHYPL